MKRTILIALAILTAAASCNKAAEQELDRLQGDLESLRQKVLPAIPEETDAEEMPTGDFSFVFDNTEYVVDAAGSVDIRYTLPENSSVEVFVGEGWNATVEGDATGVISVTAPDPAHPSELVAIATSATGRRTAAKLPLMVRDPYTEATRPVMEAMGYYSFKPWTANLENYRKLADAGITMVTVETDESDYLDQMDMARAVGIKVLAVIGWATGGWYNNMSDENLARLEQLIESLKNRPELFGYHICDEPSVDNIFELMAIEDKMTQLDPGHPVYVNLRPNGTSEGLGASSYDQYVEVFASMMHLKQLSFDMYPALANGYMQSDWHYCLRTVSNAAKRYGKPFWAFAASCWINKEAVLIERAKPTVENILLQVYTDLAYGAQAIQYFTIQDYSGTDFAPIMRDGTWTEAYDILKEANLRMQKRAFIFKGGDVRHVRRIGAVATLDDILTPDDLPEGIDDIVAPVSATVSFIENDGNEYIVIINDLLVVDQQIAIYLNKPVYYIDSDANFTLYEAGAYGFLIPKGGMLAFKYR